MSDTPRKTFATLGMFIIDEFEYLDADGRPTGKVRAPQVGLSTLPLDPAVSSCCGVIRSVAAVHMR